MSQQGNEGQQIVILVASPIASRVKMRYNNNGQAPEVFDRVVKCPHKMLLSRPRSSVVEQSTFNRLAVGSSPTAVIFHALNYA